jgi:hypothetical protein
MGSYLNSSCSHFCLFYLQSSDRLRAFNERMRKSSPVCRSGTSKCLKFENADGSEPRFVFCFFIHLCLGFRIVNDHVFKTRRKPKNNLWVGSGFWLYWPYWTSRFNLKPAVLCGFYLNNYCSFAVKVILQYADNVSVLTLVTSRFHLVSFPSSYPSLIFIPGQISCIYWEFSCRLLKVKDDAVS